jgi:chromosome partitioning protein
MTVFAVVHTKGGVGKSTTAVHLAAMLARTATTLLIDADPQASAASWAAWRAERDDVGPSPTTIQLLGKAITSEGTTLAKGFTHTVIDAGGRDAIGIRSALLLADIAVIPSGTGAFESASLSDLIDILELALDFNQKLQIKVIVSRVKNNSVAARKMQAFLVKKKLPTLTAQIGERVIFDTAIFGGTTVQELKTDLKAIEEMEAVLLELTA